MAAEGISTPPPSAETKRRLRSSLLCWFDKHGRDLPWRRSRDPYRVWVSEVMLQQTTVRVVVPYFERFVSRFPTLPDLAAAEEDEVLALWSGLGYYRRARDLHRAARHLTREHGGRFPATLDAALATPGVGLYTASAVLSISAGAPLPVVDGNVRRVLSRLFAVRASPDEVYLDLARLLLHPRHPGRWNEALMELGATVCTPRTPTCPRCPVRACCHALRAGVVSRFPEARPRRGAVDLTVHVALITRRGKLLLVRRSDRRLLGRLWELPQTPMESGASLDLERALRERYGIMARRGALRAVVSHAITFRRMRLEGYEARLTGPLPSDPERFRFVSSDELALLPVSSMTRKLAAGLTNRRVPRKL